MTNPFEKKPSAPASAKLTHISARLTSEQFKVVRQFGVRNGRTTQQMILAALAMMIEDFPPT